MWTSGEGELLQWLLTTSEKLKLYRSVVESRILHCNIMAKWCHSWGNFYHCCLNPNKRNSNFYRVGTVDDFKQWYNVLTLYKNQYFCAFIKFNFSCEQKGSPGVRLSSPRKNKTSVIWDSKYTGTVMGPSLHYILQINCLNKRHSNDALLSVDVGWIIRNGPKWKGSKSEKKVDIPGCEKACS